MPSVPRANGKTEFLNDCMAASYKQGALDALVLYGDVKCDRCVVGEDCDQERSCEEQIADVLCARLRGAKA